MHYAEEDHVALAFKMTVFAIALAFSIQCAWAQSREAQRYPLKPIRLVVPTASGGGVDTVARIIGQALTASWNQQVVVDNRGGASGIIGAEIVARAPADGYTLLVTPTTFCTNVSLFRKLPYDPHRDFTPVSLISKEPNILMVHASLPVKSVKELIALARSRATDLNFGFGGVGSSASLSGELFKLKTGVRMVGVSYKGNGPAVTALVAGEVQVMFPGLPATLFLIKSGKLRALAVTSPVRSPFLPDLPTMAEAGIPEFDVSNWIGMMGPATIPSGTVHQLGLEVARILAATSTKERFNFHGITPESSTPEEFGKFLNREIERWGQIIKSAGLQPN